MDNLSDLRSVFISGNNLSGCVPQSLKDADGSDVSGPEFPACEPPAAVTPEPAPAPEATATPAPEPAPTSTAEPSETAPSETPPASTPEAETEAEAETSEPPEASETPTPSVVVRRPPPDAPASGGGLCSAPADGAARADAGLLLAGLALAGFALASRRRRWRG